MVDAESPSRGLSTRERILQAALRCFAADGPVGARVDDIAATAGVNKRMLYHYFGDKAGLFRAVVEERVMSALGDPGNPADLAWLGDLPADQWRVLVWQAQQAASWGLEGVVEAVAAGQRAGKFRHDVSPEVIALCLVGAHALPKLLGRQASVGDPQQFIGEIVGLLAPVRREAVRPRLRIKPVVQPRGLPDNG